MFPGRGGTRPARVAVESTPRKGPSATPATVVAHANSELIDRRWIVAKAGSVTMSMRSANPAKRTRASNEMIRTYSSADERTTGGTAFKGHNNELRRGSSLSAPELTGELPTTQFMAAVQSRRRVSASADVGLQVCPIGLQLVDSRLD